LASYRLSKTSAAVSECYLQEGPVSNIALLIDTSRSAGQCLPTELLKQFPVSSLVWMDRAKCTWLPTRQAFL